MRVTRNQIISTRKKAMHSRSRALRLRYKVSLFRLRRQYRRQRHHFGSGTVNFTWLWLLESARRHGWKGALNGPSTGLRTYNQQAKLYNLFITGKGAPAFPPNGPSRHLEKNVKRLGQWSQAVDVSDPEGLIRAARKFGVRLHRPYLPQEPWHVEAAHKFHAPKNYV